MRFWHVLGAIWTAFFALLIMAATVPAGTAVSNLASWAELFHLYDLVPYLTKPLDFYTRWFATFMALAWYTIRAYENRDWLKRQYDKMRKRFANRCKHDTPS